MKLSARLFQVTAVVAFLAGAPASASSLSGYWLTEDRAMIVGIDHCDETRATICGVMVSFPGASSDPELAAAQDALCQQPILWDFSQVSGFRWRDGKIFDPVGEKIYAAELSLDGDRLSVQVATGFLGLRETLVWTRISGGVAACEGSNNARQ
jgi:uncharacterized protein (DUF2147 family)